jgi:hypothetical protein
MRDREFRVHPSDEELASFIDNQLETKRKELIKKHIIQCQRCRSSVTGAVKEKRKIKPINSTKNFRILIPLAVASLVIVFVPIFDEPSFVKSLEVTKVSLFDMFVEWVKSLF